MRILYYGDEDKGSDNFLAGSAGIFLAGPTSKEGRTAWRIEAIELFRECGYDGNLYIPEFEDGQFEQGKDKLGWHGMEIIEWETKYLQQSSVILFWMPFSDKLPGLTTRAEFGYWIAKQPKKVVVGAKAESHMSMWFITFHAEKANIVVQQTLVDTVRAAVRLVSLI